MKSYFLEELHDAAAVRAALDDVMPEQADPWLVPVASGDDIIAYLDVHEGVPGDTQGPFVVHAGVSGRHYQRDREVIDALRRLQARVGGVIRSDDGELIA